MRFPNIQIPNKAYLIFYAENHFHDFYFHEDLALNEKIRLEKIRREKFSKENDVFIVEYHKK